MTHLATLPNVHVHRFLDVFVYANYNQIKYSLIPFTMSTHVKNGTSKKPAPATLIKAAKAPASEKKATAAAKKLPSKTALKAAAAATLVEKKKQKKQCSLEAITGPTTARLASRAGVYTKGDLVEQVRLLFDEILESVTRPLAILLHTYRRRTVVLENIASIIPYTDLGPRKLYYANTPRRKKAASKAPVQPEEEAEAPKNKKTKKTSV
jgi:hypothetical protein